jgi:hypothetical protein
LFRELYEDLILGLIFWMFVSETLLVPASLSLVGDVMKSSLDIVRMQEVRVPDGEGGGKGNCILAWKIKWGPQLENWFLF